MTYLGDPSPAYVINGTTLRIWVGFIMLPINVTIAPSLQTRFMFHRFCPITLSGTGRPSSDALYI